MLVTEWKFNFTSFLTRQSKQTVPGYWNSRKKWFHFEDSFHFSHGCQRHSFNLDPILDLFQSVFLSVSICRGSLGIDEFEQERERWGRRKKIEQISFPALQSLPLFRYASLISAITLCSLSFPSHLLFYPRSFCACCVDWNIIASPVAVPRGAHMWKWQNSATNSREPHREQQQFAIRSREATWKIWNKFANSAVEEEEKRKSLKCGNKRVKFSLCGKCRLELVRWMCSPLMSSAE